MNFVLAMRLLIEREKRSCFWSKMTLAGWVGLVALLVPGAVLAESRTALVVGNGAYQDAPLKNPANDARDMAAKLRELGFQVIERLDADRQTLRLVLREFEQQLRQRRGVGLFYYAGHGVQLKGQNYLIPIGADIRQEFEVPDEGVDADIVLRAMESAGNELNIVILDACRNNPFTRGFGGGRGLARMEGPAGTFIAYATAPGAVSQDGASRNSPYTRHLLAAMSMPGLSLEQVFKQVLVAVEQESGGGQIPWVASSLRGEFYFAPTPVAPTPPAGPQPGASPTGESTPVASVPPAASGAASQPPSAPVESDWAAVPGADFAISRHTVSLDAYRRFAEASGRTAPPASSAMSDGPARVTWREAMDYAAWLSARTGKGYRLPAELEWEYAARAGVMAAAPDSDEQVREWTCSEYRREYEGQEQRCASRLPEAVAIRGGNWRAGADPLSDDLEFRLVREP